MDNKTKQYLAVLEARVMHLERLMENMSVAFSAVAQELNYHPQLNCSRCGVYEPQKHNYVCGVPDCCQGLNPEDDEKSHVQ